MPKTTQAASELIREFDDAGYWLRLMLDFQDASRIVNNTTSNTAYRRHERAARKLFAGLVGRKPTAQELEDILY